MKWKQISIADAFEMSMRCDWDVKEIYRGAGPDNPFVSMVFDDYVLVVESVPGAPPRFWLADREGLQGIYRSPVED